MFALLLSVALAQEPAPVDSPPPAAPPAAPVEAAEPTDVGGMLDAAILRREQGDFDGAEARLRQIVARPDAPPAAYYQLGIVLEVREHGDEALSFYDKLAASFPGTPEADDAAYRAAVVLDDLHRPDEALARLDAIEASRDWPTQDKIALALERGVAEIELGKASKGISRIQEGLGQVEGTDVLKWQRARARAALLQVQLSEANKLPMDKPKRAAKNLAKRRQLINEAEAQRAAITALGEPEYALCALLAIGEASLALYHDTIAAPAPRKIARNPELLAYYQEQVGKEAERFRTVALQYLVAGADLAARVRWAGATANALREQRDALYKELGISPEPTPAPEPEPEP